MSDELPLLFWRDSPSDRKYQLSGNLIDESSHREWFRKRITIKDANPFWAYEQNDMTIGFFRAEINKVSPKEFQVSILVSPNYRGKGLGYEILADAIESMRHLFPKHALLATIHRENIPSLTMFLRAGFLLQSTVINDFLQFRLTL
jgi:L-amino acid N-acyltransferase YncA